MRYERTQPGVPLVDGMNREERRKLEKKARREGKRVKRRMGQAYEAQTRALLAVKRS